MTIPENVIERILQHRPNLSGIIGNLRAASNPAMVKVLEKRLADAYLCGETVLSPGETWALAACSVGKPYGVED